jgi:pre-mRNA-splicing factor 38A
VKTISAWLSCTSLIQLTPGGYTLTTFDEFIDELLTQDRVCDIILPRLTQRAVLEETEGLAARKSLLEDEDEKRAPSEGSRASSPDLRRGRSSSVSSAGSRERFVSRSPSRSDSEDEGEVGDTRFVSRSPSLSPDREAAMQGERIDGDV